MAPSCLTCRRPADHSPDTTGTAAAFVASPPTNHRTRQYRGAQHPQPLMDTTHMKLQVLTALAGMVLCTSAWAQPAKSLLHDRELPVVAAPNFAEPLATPFNAAKGKWTPKDGVLGVLEYSRREAHPGTAPQGGACGCRHRVRIPFRWARLIPRRLRFRQACRPGGHQRDGHEHSGRFGETVAHDCQGPDSC